MRCIYIYIWQLYTARALHADSIQERHALCQHGGRSLLYTAAIYTPHTRKALSLSEYSCHIQLIQGRHSLFQNGGPAFVYSCHIQPAPGRHSLLPEYSCHIQPIPGRHSALPEWRPLPFVYSWHLHFIPGRHSHCQHGCPSLLYTVSI